MARTKNFDQDTVLDKAVDIFRRQGYRGTTPAELVEHLGISRSSLYDTYGDKR
jgi:TetR/AcrR family transcriptional repressor of nem operon